MLLRLITSIILNLSIRLILISLLILTISIVFSWPFLSCLFYVGVSSLSARCGYLGASCRYAMLCLPSEVQHGFLVYLGTACCIYREGPGQKRMDTKIGRALRTRLVLV